MKWRKIGVRSASADGCLYAVQTMTVRASLRERGGVVEFLAETLAASRS
jgi:hypothetical protein